MITTSTVRERTASNDTFMAASLMRLGERQRELGRNRQDFGTVLACPYGIVLVVADGVSCIAVAEAEVPSHNEAGSFIVGEVAAKAAIMAMKAGIDDDGIVDHVARVLHGILHPVWNLLEEDARFGLTTTLLLGLVRPRSARVFCSGDGCWGLTAPIPDGLAWNDLRVDGEALIARPSHHVVDGRVLPPRSLLVRGHVQQKHHNRFASTAARKETPSAVRGELRLVLSFDGEVGSVHVATDGLLDEPKALELLRGGPIAVPFGVERALQRPEGCDDVAVAWATRFDPDDSVVRLPRRTPHTPVVEEGVSHVA